MRVVFTRVAARHLEELHAYIAERAGAARADAYCERIVAYCRGFATFPERGARRDDLLPGLRTNGFERRATIAFYVGEAEIVIEGVFYGGRDWEKAFDRP